MPPDEFSGLVHYGAQHGFRGKWSSVRNGLAPEPRHVAPSSGVAAIDPWRLVRGASGVKFNSKGEPYSADLDTMSAEGKARVAASIASIKKNGFDLSYLRAQQAMGGVTNNSTNNSRSMTAGDINVNVSMGSESNPYKVGGAIADRLRRTLDSAQPNTGLE